MSEQTKTSNEDTPRPRRNWAPYILIFPSFFYLLIFFAWPMVQALRLALYEEDVILTMYTEPDPTSEVTGQVEFDGRVAIVAIQGVPLQEGEEVDTNVPTEVWYLVKGEAESGDTLEGWISSARVRVDDPEQEGADPTSGSIRRSLRASAEPRYDLYATPGNVNEVVGPLEAGTEVAILEVSDLVLWYKIRGPLPAIEDDDGNVTYDLEATEGLSEGWVSPRHLQIIEEGTLARVLSGDQGRWTTKFIERMVNDRFFSDALLTTILLMIVIIPIQFVLAIVMALVIQARLKGNTFFLYFFSIPLGVSELAVGIVWFAIFTQSGFLNSFLVGIGAITPDQTVTFISPDTRHWIFLAIILAEVWRATSIVMVIVVSGLQAVPQEFIEAGEVFGANLWQRLRYIIIPLLRPSLQVALILRTILAFQVFAVIIVFGGDSIVTVLARETYRQYYTLQNDNVAAAYAGLILVLSLITAFFYLRAVRTQEEMAA